MFKKPRRHFRQRKLTDGSDEEDREYEPVQILVPKQPPAKTNIKLKEISATASGPGGGTGSNGAKAKKKQTKVTNSTPISFEVEGEGCIACQIVIFHFPYDI